MAPYKIKWREWSSYKCLIMDFQLLLLAFYNDFSYHSLSKNTLRHVTTLVVAVFIVLMRVQINLRLNLFIRHLVVELTLKTESLISFFIVAFHSNFHISYLSDIMCTLNFIIFEEMIENIKLKSLCLNHWHTFEILWNIC